MGPHTYSPTRYGLAVIIHRQPARSSFRHPLPSGHYPAYPGALPYPCRTVGECESSTDVKDLGPPGGWSRSFPRTRRRWEGICSLDSPHRPARGSDGPEYRSRSDTASTTAPPTGGLSKSIDRCPREAKTYPKCAPAGQAEAVKRVRDCFWGAVRVLTFGLSRIFHAHPGHIHTAH